MICNCNEQSLISGHLIIMSAINILPQPIHEVAVHDRIPTSGRPFTTHIVLLWVNRNSARIHNINYKPESGTFNNELISYCSALKSACISLIRVRSGIKGKSTSIVSAHVHLFEFAQ